VIIPWRELGKNAAALMQLALGKERIGARRIVIPPLAVAARRSSDARGAGANEAGTEPLWYTLRRS
jgi:hypothetical protein